MSSRSFKTFVFICLLGLFLIALASGIMAQSPQPSLAPMNPAFVDYFERKARGTLLQTTEEGYALGLIPPPVDLSQIRAPRVLQGQVLSLPATYDLRTQGKLTAIRNQGGCGSCWAFAAYGSLESCLLPGESTNFSENNLKNMSGFDLGCCDGGNHYMVSAYLGRWSGPAYETDDPYNTGSCSSPSIVVRKHVQNVDFIPDRTGPTDNDRIKQAVMTYGAVYTSFYWGSSYYNPTYYAYYFNGSTYSNHAVCIVGWDDNFDRTKFLAAPPANGAFIVRNSWGTSWGQSGYFYMSYYDSNFGKENAVFRVPEPTNNYTTIYQYDPYGWVGSVGFGATTAWFANVFTAVTSEVLSAVSLYAASPGSSYEIQVHLDPTGGPRNPSGPAATFTGTLVNAGYQTIPIAGPALTTGHNFSVVVMLNTPGYNYPIPVEAPSSGYSSGATSIPGQSYMSQNGTSWSGLYTNFNCCLKAFTRDTAGLIVTPTSGLVSMGPVGGPFSPASQDYTLTNSGTLSMDWSAGKTQPWVTLSSTGGSLGVGESTTATVSINSEAESLASGEYSDVVSFVNNTNGQGNTTRSVNLSIGDPCLDVTPVEGLTSYGESGGPFNPPSKTYALTNTGCANLNWIAAKSQSWLDVSPAGGSLSPGATVDAAVTFNSAAEELPLGTYSDTILFTNLTNGCGNTSREVNLTIARNYFIEPAVFEWIEPSGQFLDVGGDGVDSFALPFTFNFYGQPYTTVYVGENGLLGFNSDLTSADNTALPTAANPNNAIYPLWDDIDAQNFGYVCAFTMGETPNRKVVITWMEVVRVGSENPLAFQVILCEGSNDIIIQYLEVQPDTGMYGNGKSATIGVENADGTVARVYSVDGSTLLNNGEAFRYTINAGDVSVFKKLADEAPVTIHRAIISCALTSQFYIESDDRSCGIMIQKTNHGFPAGIRVDVKGTLATLGSGERYVRNPTITPNGKGRVRPLTTTNRDLGGEDFDYSSLTGAGQIGVQNPRGPCNIGLLMRVTGRVMFVGDIFFYIDDGSKLDDGSGYLGVKVIGTEVTMPGLNKYVRLIGASSCWKNGTEVHRQIGAAPQVIEQYD